MPGMERLAGRLVQKVPLFFGFKPAEMKAFLDICKLSTQPRGEVICEYGTASSRLFILLDGELEVVAQDGTELAAIQPITVVGEMGFISRKPRSATVRVKKPGRLLRTEYHEFEALVERNAELRAKIYRNMVRILADRLSDANDRVARYRKLYESDARGVEGDGEGAGSAPAAAGKETAVQKENDEIRADRVLQSFYDLAQVAADEAQRLEDRELYMQLRREGYSQADIEYAIKWAIRNIPSIRRFNLVKLSIDEAFEDKWSM